MNLVNKIVYHVEFEQYRKCGYVSYEENGCLFSVVRGDHGFMRIVYIIKNCISSRNVSSLYEDNYILFSLIMY